MTRFTHLVIAVVSLLVPAPPLLGSAEEKGDKSAREQVVLLDGANTVLAEFRVGAGGKIGIEFRFADGKTQILLGVVQADEMKRTVLKDGRGTTSVADTPGGGPVRTVDARAQGSLDLARGVSPCLEAQ